MGRGTTLGRARIILLLLVTAGICGVVCAKEVNVAKSVSVTVLSSNLASGATVGEWGFSALVEVDGHCVLFDTGRYPDTVLRNAKVLGVDLSCVTDVVLSHFHFDHTDGLMPLLKDLRRKNPAAIKCVHVAEGFFWQRRIANGGDNEVNGMIAMRQALAAEGVEFKIYSEATEILLEQVQRDIQDHSIHALMGGMHLFAADDETLRWTSDRLRDVGIQHLMAGHCTGIEPLMYLRASLGLSRRTAVVGAVGSRFVYGEGIYPTAIAQ